jgi:hypothetical protein
MAGMGIALRQRHRIYMTFRRPSQIGHFVAVANIFSSDPHHGISLEIDDREVKVRLLAPLYPSVLSSIAVAC